MQLHVGPCMGSALGSDGWWGVVWSITYYCAQCKHLVGASLSEPHIDEYNVHNICMFVCLYVWYVRHLCAAIDNVLCAIQISSRGRGRMVVMFAYYVLRISLRTFYSPSMMLSSISNISVFSESIEATRERRVQRRRERERAKPSLRGSRLQRRCERERAPRASEIAANCACFSLHL